MTARASLLAAFLLFIGAATLPAQDTSILSAIRITDMELRYTSGTQLLQDVRAESARLAPGAHAVDAEGIDVRILDPETEREVLIASPFARFYHQAEIATIEERDLSNDELLALREDVASFSPEGRDLTVARRGDFLLLDPEGGMGVEADLGEDSSLDATTLYWSETWQRFLALGPFTQTMRGEGSRIAVNGTAFQTSRTFSMWHYPVMDEDDLTFDVIPEEETP